MNVPKVSVLIPCYNAADFIGETLDSVFRQSWPNIEIIVVDDGSTDGSSEIVKSMAHSSLRLVTQKNRGQTAALNTALSQATGDFIQYLDADDLLEREKIERQMNRLSGSPTAVASAEWARFRNALSEAEFQPECVWHDMEPIDWLASSRKRGLGMMFPALWLIPSEIVKKAGPWREDLSLNNDAEYFTRVLLQSEAVLFCPGARCYYRSGVAGSLSGRKSRTAFVSQWKVNELCEAHVRAREDSERVRRGFALTWQHLAHASYPYAPDIAEEALKRARALHSIEVAPEGGSVFRLASGLLGWRVARRLQVLSGRV